MAEDQYQVLNNGQAFQTQDANLLGLVAGLADDRALAELLRVKAYGGSVLKYILPFGDGNLGKNGTVIPTGSGNGSVFVNPFRAIIGPTTAEGTDSKKSWRDIRSGLFMGSPTARQGLVNFSNNSSGNPRWDLVQAVVTRDANGTSQSRKVKDPTTKVISTVSTVVQLVQTVTVSVVAGTPGASPTFPSPTADSSSTFYIPLAYVRIPNGFNASSTIGASDIANVPSVAPISRAGGAASAQVANGMYAAGGVVLSSANQGSWGSGGLANRPHNFTPSEHFGCEMVNVFVTTKSENGQVVNADVLDDRDWRGRRCVAFVCCTPTGGNDFAQNAPGNDNLESLFSAGGQTFGAHSSLQFGQTIIQEPTAANKGYCCRWTNTTLSTLGATNEIGVYCDLADSGKLKFHKVNTPSIRAWIIIFFFGPHTNGV